MVSDTAKHYPVLLSEIISIISPQHGGTFIDCTFGQGGYSSKILSFHKTKVIALDRDIETQKLAEKILDKFNNRFIFKNIKFSNLDNLKVKNENIKGIIFDLGYSFSQIKDPKKGLSFNSTGDLNKQMGINDFSANDVINKLHAEELEKIFKFFGEEKEAKKIASEIIAVRKKKKIDTPALVELIDRIKSKRYSKIHSATKVFQALRIFVNKEISELIYGLINATKVLKRGGVLGVVTFHSLEDKIVKYFFKSLSENKSISRYSPVLKQADTLFNLIHKKPITPSEEEVSENLPSRSAKFRYVIKKNDFYNFDTDIEEQFRNYIEIENYGDKLWKSLL